MMPRPFGSLQTSRFCPAELMRDHIGAVPVVDGPESMLLIGVITVRDIVLRHVGEAHHHDCAST